MLSGLYGAATGMNAAAAQHEVIARNLAHSQVPGFRKGLVVMRTFESALDAAQQAQVRGEAWGVALAQTATDFSPGGLQRTGAPLDVAIEGDGFFVLSGPDGPLYTRNGTFHRDEQGELVSADGLAVEGDGGAISVPEDVSTDQIVINEDGTVRAGGAELGRIQVVQFADTSRLRSAGATLFSAAGAAPEPATPKVVQGARELSNVSAVEELVRMLAGMRHYEASQRAMRSIGEAVQQHTNPQGG